MGSRKKRYQILVCAHLVCVCISQREQIQHSTDCIDCNNFCIAVKGIVQHDYCHPIIDMAQKRLQFNICNGQQQFGKLCNFPFEKKELQIRIVSHVIDAHFDIAAQQLFRPLQLHFGEPQKNVNHGDPSATASSTSASASYPKIGDNFRGNNNFPPVRLGPTSFFHQADYSSTKLTFDVKSFDNFKTAALYFIFHFFFPLKNALETLIHFSREEGEYESRCIFATS